MLFRSLHSMAFLSLGEGFWATGASWAVGTLRCMNFLFLLLFFYKEEVEEEMEERERQKERKREKKACVARTCK